MSNLFIIDVWTIPFLIKKNTTYALMAKAVRVTNQSFSDTRGRLYETLP